MAEVTVKAHRGQVNKITSMFDKKVLTNMQELNKAVKEEWLPAQHVNYVAGLVRHPSKRLVMSYDVNGVVHFWPF
jgi:hypothetical protein